MEAIKIQSGWKYGFANENEKKRAIALPDLGIEELEGFPNKQPIAEGDFLRFDRLAKVGKSRKQKFKAKAIRNSMNLINSDNFGIEKIAKMVTLMLLR